MFITSFQNNHGFEIKIPAKIASHYVKTWRFLFDCLALLGVYFLREVHPAFRYFQLFKAFRIIRINEVIDKSHLEMKKKAVLKIIKNVAFLFFYLHWIACAWWFATSFNGPKVLVSQPESE